jgi:hypothetical protein
MKLSECNDRKEAQKRWGERSFRENEILPILKRQSRLSSLNQPLLDTLNHKPILKDEQS